MSGESVKISSLQIGSINARIPIVQGGMGVGISRSGLAAAVAKEGGIGVIAAVGLGELAVGMKNNPMSANCDMLKREITTAKENAPGGIIGVNVMMVLSDSTRLIETSIESGANILFLGAGFPRLPDSVLEKIDEIKTQFAVIVSSARAMKLVFRSWLKRYSILPDAVVVEGPMAGGHLGFKKEDLTDPDYALENILPPVIAEAKEVEKQHGKKIPVIAAGGIFTGADIFKYLKMGASGVQMGTRFAATAESDASDEFKQAYLDCKEGEISVITSPVGLPGRAIANDFLRKVEDGTNVPFKCQYKCLTTCDPHTAPYCIAKALVNARSGNLANGFAFAGENAWRVNTIISVKELMTELLQGITNCMKLEKLSILP